MRFWGRSDPEWCAHFSLRTKSCRQKKNTKKRKWTRSSPYWNVVLSILQTHNVVFGGVWGVGIDTLLTTLLRFCYWMRRSALKNLFVSVKFRTSPLRKRVRAHSDHLGGIVEYWVCSTQSQHRHRFSFVLFSTNATAPCIFVVFNSTQPSSRYSQFTSSKMSTRVLPVVFNPAAGLLHAVFSSVVAHLLLLNSAATLPRGGFIWAAAPRRHVFWLCRFRPKWYTLTKNGDHTRA